MSFQKNLRDMLTTLNLRSEFNHLDVHAVFYRYRITLLAGWTKIKTL